MSPRPGLLANRATLFEVCGWSVKTMQLFGSAVDTAICRAQNTRGMRRAKALQKRATLPVRHILAT
jgi:hypothetical protein